MSANQAQIEISAVDKTKEAFESVGNAVSGLKSHFVHLAELAGVAMFGEMIRGSLESADQLNKMSQSVGVSVESLSRLSLSAKLSDVDMETLAKSMGKLDKGIRDAADGTGTGAQAFDYLGIKVKDSQGHLKNSDVIMAEVADKFAGLEDGAGKTALAMDIFGKAGAGMIPMLNAGSQSLRENAEMSDRLGLTLTKETAAGAEVVNDRFALMGQAAKGMANTAMTQLLPTIDKISKMFVDAATDTDTLKKEFGALEIMIKSVITIGVVVKDVFAQIGTVIGGVAAAIVLALTGDFKGAKDAIVNMSHDMVESMSNDIGSIAKVWTENTPKIKAAAKESGKQAVGGYAAAVVDGSKAAYSEAMAMLEQEFKERVAYGQKHQTNLNMQLANMLISERQFSNSKQQLLLAGLAQEQQILQKELELAQKNNDAKKAIELKGAIERNKIATEEASGPTAYDAKAKKAAQTLLEIENKSYKDRLDLAEQYRKNNGEQDGRYKMMSEQAQIDHENAISSLIQKGAVTRLDYDKMTGKQQLQTHISLLSNMLSASATHSRAAFEAVKVLQLAQAAINLPATVIAAYKSGMEAGGPFGPAVGAAYAALAFATQMIQIDAINSASFGGGASGGSAPSAGGMAATAIPGQMANPNSVGSTPSSAANAAGTSAMNAPAAQPVNVYIQGNVMTADFVTNTVIPEIKNQITNADVTIIDPRSRQAQMLAGA
jgi:hypothetical protein